MPGQVSHGMGMILAGSGEKPLADSPIALQDDSAAALRFNLQRHESMLPCVRARPRLWERGGIGVICSGRLRYSPCFKLSKLRLASQAINDVPVLHARQCPLPLGASSC